MKNLYMSKFFLLLKKQNHLLFKNNFCKSNRNKNLFLYGYNKFLNLRFVKSLNFRLLRLLKKCVKFIAFLRFGWKRFKKKNKKKKKKNKKRGFLLRRKKRYLFRALEKGVKVRRKKFKTYKKRHPRVYRQMKNKRGAKLVKYNFKQIKKNFNLFYLKLRARKLSIEKNYFYKFRSQNLYTNNLSFFDTKKLYLTRCMEQVSKIRKQKLKKTPVKRFKKFKNLTKTEKGKFLFSDKSSYFLNKIYFNFKNLSNLTKSVYKKSNFRLPLEKFVNRAIISGQKDRNFNIILNSFSYMRLATGLNAVFAFKIIFKKLFSHIELKPNMQTNDLVPGLAITTRKIYSVVTDLLKNARNNSQYIKVYEKLGLELLETLFESSTTYENLLKKNELINDSRMNMGFMQNKKMKFSYFLINDLMSFKDIKTFLKKSILRIEKRIIPAEEIPNFAASRKILRTKIKNIYNNLGLERKKNKIKTLHHNIFLKILAKTYFNNLLSSIEKKLFKFLMRHSKLFLEENLPNLSFFSKILLDLKLSKKLMFKDSKTMDFTEKFFFKMLNVCRGRLKTLNFRKLYNGKLKRSFWYKRKIILLEKMFANSRKSYYHKYLKKKYLVSKKNKNNKFKKLHFGYFRNDLPKKLLNLNEKNLHYVLKKKSFNIIPLKIKDGVKTFSFRQLLVKVLFFFLLECFNILMLKLELFRNLINNSSEKDLNFIFFKNEISKFLILFYNSEKLINEYVHYYFNLLMNNYKKHTMIPKLKNEIKRIFKEVRPLKQILHKRKKIRNKQRYFFRIEQFEELGFLNERLALKFEQKKAEYRAQEQKASDKRIEALREGSELAYYLMNYGFASRFFVIKHIKLLSYEFLNKDKKLQFLQKWQYLFPTNCMYFNNYISKNKELKFVGNFIFTILTEKKHLDKFLQKILLRKLENYFFKIQEDGFFNFIYALRTFRGIAAISAMFFKKTLFSLFLLIFERKSITIFEYDFFKKFIMYYI